MKMRNRWLECTGQIIVFPVLWGGSVKLLHVSPLPFLFVEEVIHTLYEGVVHGGLIWQGIYSMGIIGRSLVINGVLAVALALLSTWSNVTENLIDTLTAPAHPLPGLMLLPLTIMWFGTRSDAVTAIMVHSAPRPVLVNLLDGFRSMPSVYEDIGRSLSMPTAAVTLKIHLRAPMAHLIFGLKISRTRGRRAFINTEMVSDAVGEKGGIGWHILTQHIFMDTAGLFVGIILVIIVGMLTGDVLFGVIGKYTLKEWGMKT